MNEKDAATNRKGAPSRREARVFQGLENQGRKFSKAWKKTPSAFPSLGKPPAWSDATPAEWRDWRWQLRHRLRSPDDLARRFPAWRPSAADRRAAARYPMAVTPYYAALIRQPSDADPIFRLCVARAAELDDPIFCEADPFHEASHEEAPGLIRRYRDRALVLVTLQCATYCRHCTRKHRVGRDGAGEAVSPRRTAEWLAARPELREALISGGDPLTLDTSQLARWLEEIRRRAPNIEILRIGTRAPVVLPQRVDRELCALLRRYHPVWMNVHFNHPAELTAEAAAACERLADAGVPLGNQTVLLHGVNDDADTLEALFRGLIRMRVRPYYLFQCDPVRGVGHFRVSPAWGRALMRELRRRLSGLAIPAYVRDAPEAESKVPM